MANQLIDKGMVLDFVPDRPDFVKVGNGIHTVYAYIPGDRNLVKVGQFYNVYKQSGTYYLGTQFEGR